MSDVEVKRGQVDLDNTSAADFLKIMCDMFDDAPDGADAYLDVDFSDRYERLRTVRMIMQRGEDYDVPLIH